MTRAASLLAITLGALTACSGGGTASSSSSSSQARSAFSVEVIVDHADIGGCSSNSPIKGNGSQLVAKDATGTIVATGIFSLRTGAKLCDWTALLNVDGTPDFITLEGDHGKLVTVARADYIDNVVKLSADVNGDIHLLPD